MTETWCPKCYTPSLKGQDRCHHCGYSGVPIDAPTKPEDAHDYQATNDQCQFCKHCGEREFHYNHLWR